MQFVVYGTVSSVVAIGVMVALVVLMMGCGVFTLFMIALRVVPVLVRVLFMLTLFVPPLFVIAAVMTILFVVTLHMTSPFVAMLCLIFTIAIVVVVAITVMLMMFTRSTLTRRSIIGPKRATSDADQEGEPTDSC